MASYSNQQLFLCIVFISLLFLNVAFCTAKKVPSNKSKKNRTPYLTISLSKPTDAEYEPLLKCTKDNPFEDSEERCSASAPPGSGLAICQRACQDAGLTGGNLEGDRCYCDCVPNPCDSNDGVGCGPAGPGVNCNHVCQAFGLGLHGHCSSEHRCICTKCPFCDCDPIAQPGQP